MQEKLWQGVLTEIESSVSPDKFATWFKKATLLSYKDSTAVIGVPNVFVQRQFETRFSAMISDAFKKNGVVVNSINFTVQSSATSKRSGVSREIPVDLPQQNTNLPVSTSSVGNTLNPKYTFDSFIVGSSNDLAYTACQAVSENPGSKYNPLFLYGGVGLGKTHLVQAVGNHIKQNNPKARVLYVSVETFVNEYLEHVRFKKGEFGGKYRNVDVLIIDDMQFIANKEKTQEEFFHTFNALHQANKQIIITSDKPPRSIPTLTERLRSRLEWGMAIDIQMPDFETRCAIIEIKAAQSNATLERETIEYLASNVKSNVRVLEGVLNQLLAYSEMRGVSPDISIAEGLIGDVRKSRPRHITSKQIIDKTAKHFQVDIQDICSPRRDKHIATPRQIAMYLLRSELHLSFPQIAVALGRKDHTTAMHSVHKIEKAMKLDLITREQVTEIREKLYV